MRIRILDPAGIEARLRRMAFEIYERNYSESHLYLIGVDVRGGFIAERLVHYLREISPLSITAVQARLDRSDRPGGIRLIPMQLSVPVGDLRDSAVVVADDVLYGGNTLLNVLSQLLPLLPRTLQVAVLIDRGHRIVPVSPDFVGMELATTLQQHVSFEIHPDGTTEAYVA